MLSLYFFPVGGLFYLENYGFVYLTFTAALLASILLKILRSYSPANSFIIVIYFQFLLTHNLYINPIITYSMFGDQIPAEVISTYRGGLLIEYLNIFPILLVAFTIIGGLIDAYTTRKAHVGKDT
ncbi:membrane hypothetical protein [Oceanicaulis sp. 350]|nr:membrane hypothetical protein [Oceanicaulis sp. 350]